MFQAPKHVEGALDSLYPGAKDVQWSKKKKHYTADFIYNDLNISVTFDKHGKCLNSVEEISFDSLPSRIRDKIKTFYGSYKIVMVLQRKLGDRLEYDIEVIQGKHHYILNYNPKGYLIHQYNIYKVDASSTPVG